MESQQTTTTTGGDAPQPEDRLTKALVWVALVLAATVVFLAVDLWQGEQVTVDFYRQLPDLGYKLIVLRVHSGLLLALVHAHQVVPSETSYLFTGERKGFFSSLVRRLYRFSIGKAGKVFFQNPDDKALFEDVGILSPTADVVVVNGSGIDVDAFKQTPLPAGDMIFLMIARLLGDKGVREYAEAAARVREVQPNARFQLAGWIDEHPDAISRQELSAWIKDGSIEFLDYLDDVRPAIEASTVYVLPSYREGTPRTVLEAMAMGRPIITTDAPGCRETVIDGENGFLVPVRSVTELVAAMERFIDNRELAVVMGKRSRQIAEEKYDVHKVNEVMLSEIGIT